MNVVVGTPEPTSGCPGLIGPVTALAVRMPFAITPVRLENTQLLDVMLTAAETEVSAQNPISKSNDGACAAAGTAHSARNASSAVRRRVIISAAPGAAPAAAGPLRRRLAKGGRA